MVTRFLACVGLASGAAADIVTLTPTRDNTLYEIFTGALSNGAGPQFYVGKNAQDSIRRALVRFDVAGAVPAGSTITDVKLTLVMSRTTSGDVQVSLLRALRDWGEGTSNAGTPGGMGAPAAPGDATWVHTFYSTVFWSTPGGAPGSDYTAGASATATVGDIVGPYSWNSTPALLADVQSWLDSPASNFGWFVIGDESTPGTAKQFESRESTNPSNRPSLRISFTPPSCYANCDASTTVPCLNVLDFVCFLNTFAAADSHANCDASTTPPVLNVLDFTCFLNRFAAGCSSC